MKAIVLESITWWKAELDYAMMRNRHHVADVIRKVIAEREALLATLS